LASTLGPGLDWAWRKSVASSCGGGVVGVADRRRPAAKVRAGRSACMSVRIMFLWIGVECALGCTALEGYH